MNIIIGSDLVPTDANLDLFNIGDTEALLGSSLNDIWDFADMRIFNLETPITDKELPIEKQGPNLISPTSTIEGIKELNPTLITLANNHIMDQDVQGLNSTRELLGKHKIPFIGAGNNLVEAMKPYIINKNGITVGFYTCAEHEFTIATENTPGANPFDPFESLDHISELNLVCDYVIVLYHGGKEHYRYPSPYLQKACRKMAEKGADLVICQHSHCIGSFEVYEESTIIYGQGNFIFNKHDNEYWNTSLLIKIDINQAFEVEYIPIVRSETGVHLATGNKSEEIINGFYKRSKKILQDDFVKKEYAKFAKNNFTRYIRRFAGFGKWKSRFDRRVFNNLLSRNKYKKQELLAIKNFIECEAHRELVLKGLDDHINRK